MARVSRPPRGVPARLSRLLSGVLTVVAFTESGRMRRVRLSNRLLVISLLLLLMLLVGATASVLQLYRGQVDLARMTYLEGENRSLTSLLEGQAEQLSRLKLEVGRLKEFEQNLRVVSGMGAPADPVVGTGQTRGARPALPKRP
ncbi:MAG TPA: hypothetical protein VMG58_02835 [Candidatus Sulfotelmatobacter sp.]|nr:hypothetical protein [Candidatus Sulfotelmatobacter sp.]